MRLWSHIAFSALLCAVSCQGTEIKKEGEVYVLDDATFDDFVAAHPNLLAEFYAPWCGHCQSLEPEYAKAAQMVKEKGLDVALTKIDATENSMLSQRFNIEGFPTLHWLKSGSQSIEYSGGMTANGIAKWVQKQMGESVGPISSVEQAKALEDEEVVVVGVFGDSQSEAALEYIKFAEGNYDVDFYITTDAEAGKYLSGGGDAVVILKQYDEGKAIHKGPFTMVDIESFVSSHWLPLVIELKEETSGKVFGGDVENHMMLLADLGSDVYKGLQACYKAAAEKFRGRLMFVVIDTAKSENEELVNYLVMAPVTEPLLMAVRFEEGAKKYMHVGELSCDSFVTFAERYLAGDVPETYASEDLPKNWDEGDLKVLVGSNYNTQVRQPGKHVFVKIYAPWCPHCQKMADDWMALAKHFADDPNVIVAEMDGTKNEAQDLVIEGFPTLRMYTEGQSGEREVLDYDGPRDLAKMKEYVHDIIKGLRPTYDQEQEEENVEGDDDEMVKEDEVLQASPMDVPGEINVDDATENGEMPKPDEEQAKAANDKGETTVNGDEGQRVGEDIVEGDVVKMADTAKKDKAADRDEL